MFVAVQIYFDFFPTELTSFKIFSHSLPILTSQSFSSVGAEVFPKEEKFSFIFHISLIRDRERTRRLFRAIVAVIEHRKNIFARIAFIVGTCDIVVKNQIRRKVLQAFFSLPNRNLLCVTFFLRARRKFENKKKFNEFTTKEREESK